MGDFCHVCFDKDFAGMRGMRAAGRNYQDQGIEVVVVRSHDFVLYELAGWPCLEKADLMLGQ